MQPRKILVQLDSDPLASVFDAVVAIDAGADHLLQYANVEPTNVLPLVHGAMFTRAPKNLNNTALFVGGSNVGVGEAIAAEIRQAFFGPMRVSCMLDGNGSNTTAAAAVLCAARHVDLSTVKALVLGGTGPVGLRVAKLLLANGARVQLSSRVQSRAEQACRILRPHLADDSGLEPVAFSPQSTLSGHPFDETNAIFGCGAAGIELASDMQVRSDSVRIAIDLNAVPPTGIGGIEPGDKAVERNDRIHYGALGVGGLKMKIHRRAVESLFEKNNLFLDTEEIFALGQQLEAQRASC